jgi:hypothetical protein
MKASRRVLYFVCFAGLAVTAASAVARVATPSLAAALFWVVIVAALAGAPGLVRRRAWPVALVLLPLGAYLAARLQLPPPPGLDGVRGQLSYYMAELRAGAHAYATGNLPFDLAGAPELKLLLAQIVYWAAATAAVLALSMRKALPAIAVLIALLAFGLTIDETSRVLGLPLVFLLLAGCLLMLCRSLEREQWKPGDALAGAATGLIASLLALTLLGTTPVAASKPWQDWRTWGSGGADAGTRLVFDWMENYPGLLDEETNAEVMRVRSPVASYWRANALDSFTGTTWFSSQHEPTRLSALAATEAPVYVVPVRYPEPPGKRVVMTFASRTLATDYYLTGGTPRALTLESRRPVYETGTQALWAGERVGPTLRYTLTAVVPELEPADLVGRGRDYPGDVRPYLLLPFPAAGEMQGPAPELEWRDAMSGSPAAREWQGLYRLNREIVGAADDPYQIALLIEQRLRFDYTYSLTPPDTAYQSPYAAFLFDTATGYCQQFAGAMAALLRFNGVPARVAVGFAPGSRVTDDTFAVTRNDAHAWVEVYIPGVGWVAFDPTPGRGLPGPGASSTSAGFADPFAGAAAAGVAPPAPFATDPSGLPQDPARGQDPGGAGGAATAASGSRWLMWAGALAAAAVFWPVARLTLRRRRASRGDTRRRLLGQLSLLRADLRDFGLEPPASQTLEETARRLDHTLGVDATAVVDRAQAVLFGGRVATEQHVAEAGRLRREVRRRLRHERGWKQALAALYGLHLVSSGGQLAAAAGGRPAWPVAPRAGVQRPMPGP